MLITCSAGPAVAGDKLNFSGKYVAEQSKRAAANTEQSRIEVVHNEDAIEITRVDSGKKTISRCPTNGSEGDYTSPGGIPGKCKAQIKGKYLIFETMVVTRPQQATPVRVHTKEKWQLSADAKILTIKSEVDFPDFPSDISTAVAGSTSGTVKYDRIAP